MCIIPSVRAMPIVTEELGQMTKEQKIVTGPTGTTLIEVILAMSEPDLARMTKVTEEGLAMTVPIQMKLTEMTGPTLANTIVSTKPILTDTLGLLGMETLAELDWLRPKIVQGQQNISLGHFVEHM